MQDRYRLADEDDYDALKRAKAVFIKAAQKVLKDSFANARIQAVVNYFKSVEKVNKKRSAEVRRTHLTEEQYLQSSVDWIMKDMDAWRWMCKWWASPEFQQTSERNRANRTSRRGEHRYGADGHVGLSQRMVRNAASTVVTPFICPHVDNFGIQEAETGEAPSFVQVFIRGHRGPDPQNPSVLCDEAAAQKMVSIVY